MSQRPLRVLLAESDTSADPWVHTALARIAEGPADQLVVRSLSQLCDALACGPFDLTLLSLDSGDCARVGPLVQGTREVGLTPVVVVGALRDEQVALQALRSGAHDYLVRSDINESALDRVVRYTVERQRLGAATTPSEERFRRLAENAPDIIYRYEVHPRRMLSYVSRAVIQILGYTPEELYLEAIDTRQMVHPADYARLKSVLRGQGTAEPLTVRMFHRDGHLVWTEHRAVPIVGPDGQIVAVEGIVRDLVERRRLEAQLAQAEKLRSLGVMASGVAHQMRNMLTSVLGHADLLLAEITDPQARQNVEAIIRAAQDGAASAARIQGLARTAPHPRTEVLDLASLANEAIEATAPRWRDQAEREGRRIEVVVTGCAPVWVRGVGPELREALTNLLLNAVDALPDGGRISVSVAGSAESAVVDVEDDGVGMSEEVMQRALDPFFTTKPVGAGTGLGLSITRGILLRHHGSITIHSEPGVGTRVTLTLPRSAAPAESPPPVVDHPVSPLRLLVVDDNPELGDQLARILRLDGHDVRTARSGAEAVAEMERAEFDAVLTDLGMAGMNGWDVAVAARLQRPGIAVVLITGWSDDVTDEDLAARGIDALISKPYRIQTVRSTLAAVAQKR